MSAQHERFTLLGLSEVADVLADPVSTADERAKARKQGVHRLTIRGLTASEIAAMLGCSRRQVHRDRRKLGIAREYAEPLTADQLAQALRLLEDGASRPEVARTLGVDESTIRRRFPQFVWTPAQLAEWTALVARGRRRP